MAFSSDVTCCQSSRLATLVTRPFAFVWVLLGSRLSASRLLGGSTGTLEDKAGKSLAPGNCVGSLFLGGTQTYPADVKVVVERQILWCRPLVITASACVQPCRMYAIA